MNIGKTLSVTPLFGVLLVGYFLTIGLLHQFYPNLHTLEATIYKFRLPSNAEWAFKLSDLIILTGLFVLYIELFKSTRASNIAITEHILSIFVFIAYLLIFLYAPVVADSTFVILGAMSFIDVIAGLTITVTAARKDLSVG